MSKVQDFKKLKTFEERLAESNRIKENFPDKIPIILVVDNKIINVIKFKYLIPSNLNMVQLHKCIRNFIKVKSYEAIFLFINNKLIPNTSLMQEVYDSYKDPDGFLYINVALESTFG
jgi:GABA(A) receptor-associated protein